jgi:hypothetical protein
MNQARTFSSSNPALGPLFLLGQRFIANAIADQCRQTRGVSFGVLWSGEPRQVC